MIKLSLTQGKFTLLDDADLSASSQKWYAAKQKTGNWYAAANIKGKLRFLHQFLLGFPKCGVDHINLDGLDNRRENLRLASQSQNQANRGRNKNNRAGFKGVSWSKSHHKWRASIQKNSIDYHLGYFCDLKEAAAAYAAAATKYFGEFARTA